MDGEKVELSVLGLSATAVPNNTFTLILKESDGNRSIPIIIGAYEAQAIAIEMERAHPSRPMAHDLIKNIMLEAQLTLIEVLLYDLKEGTYFSKLVFDEDDIEIDCRPSDGVAIALRCNCPIYIMSHILDEVGIFATLGNVNNVPTAMLKQNKQHNKLEQLQTQLNNAIKNEDYESAAKIRDEIKLYLDN